MSNKPIHDEDTPDPWMLAHDGKFYLTCTKGTRVEIWLSHEMEDFRKCEKSVVWQPSPNTPWSVNLWAPELHYINSIWYIYFTAAHPDGKEASHATHRTLLLRCDGRDPMKPGSWSFCGPLKGLPDHWSIDATVFSPFPNELYCCYSGWPLGDTSDKQQDLFLIKLKSPEEAVPETLVCISCALLPWERCEGNRHGVNEGPTWVDFAPGFRGIVYSASGSWTNDYKLGLLQLIGHDILQSSSWKKRNAPLLVSDHRAPFGPGHASFVKMPQRPDEIFCVYHSTGRRDDGWKNRKGRVIGLRGGHFDSNARSLCCADFLQQSYQASDQADNESAGSEKDPAKKGSHGILGRVLDRIK